MAAGSGTIASAVSDRADADEAVAELRTQLGAGPFAIVFVFCAPALASNQLAACMRAAFPDAVVVGCTTAGEITPRGYEEETIAAIGFPAGPFDAGAVRLGPVHGRDLGEARRRVRAVVDQLERRGGDPARMFACLLIDGLSRREEALTSAIHAALDGIPLFGGSAGDGLAFTRTAVLADGAFHPDGAVVAVLGADRPFRVFKTQHFVSTGRKMVVTEADPVRRVVTEINAEPAAAEYARVVGIDAAELSPLMFATHPVVVRIGGQDYVRAIQKVNPDASLTFFCAIDQGIVLTVAEGGDLIAGLDRLFAELRAEIGEPEAIIGCDCLLRRLECEQRQIRHLVSARFAANRVIGFCTYGEQYGPMHVNQTFTGVAIGRAPS